VQDHLAIAEAALKAGRGAEAIAPLIAAVEANPNRPPPIYRALVTQLYLAARLDEGATWGEIAARRFPRDLEILNTLGVIYRRLRRYPEALAALDRAANADPNHPSVLQNRGNVLLEMDDNAAAEAVLARLVRIQPRNPDARRQLARAFSKQDKPDAAMGELRQAVTLRPGFVEAWMDLVRLLDEQRDADGAAAAIDEALAAKPEDSRLLEAKAVNLLRAGQPRAAQAYLTALVPRFEKAGWLHYQLGAALADTDRERANAHLRRAVVLAPDKLDFRMLLIDSLIRTTAGDEGANLDEAYQLSRPLLALQPADAQHLKTLSEVLRRVCAFDEPQQLGDFATLGRAWAKAGLHTALLGQLSQVRTPQDRSELLDQHSLWGQLEEAAADRHPIVRPPARRRDGRIRLGLMSSDLRAHPVGYFAQPLFDHRDPGRFELYCYSFCEGRQPDPLQAYFMERSTAFRWIPDTRSRDVAQVIADDQLDMLVELGGSTHMNKLDVMAFKPAPIQASWLGYPHSAGLSAIDYFVCDPYSRPTDPALMIEKPLVMPHSWLALGKAVFSDGHVLVDGLPEERNGFLTFGTANNPHKYNRGVLTAWARVLAAVPGSRFAFVRPEGSSATFRRNVLGEFAAHGIGEERIVFNTIRAAHMPFYNEMDISLDPFPLTGGTTTTESLWMGVPVVSLRGEAFFERLSYSILSNAGLGDLVAKDLDEYQAIALKLAGDRERRRELRAGMRERLRASPLGQTEAFARDFYDMIARAVLDSRESGN